MWDPEATSEPISEGGLSRTLGVLGANKTPVHTHTNSIRAWGWDKVPSESDSPCAGVLGYLRTS